MQHYIDEESILHERALQAVRSVSDAVVDGTETKDNIADLLREFPLLEHGHSLAQNRCLFLALLETVTRTITLQTR